MGLIDQKKSVFTTIGSYTSMMQSGTMPDTTNLFPSINNKKDIVPYLLDVLKVVVGTDALQQLTGELFTNLINKIEPELKSGIIKQNTQSNSGEDILTTHSWFNTNGITMPVKDIDVFGKYKTVPNSTASSLLFDSGAPTFDNSAFDAIRNGSATFGNLLIAYNSGTDTFNFKPNLAVNPNPSVGDFVNTFVNGITVINKKEFMTGVMNMFYGSITKNQGKSVEEVTQELEIQKLIDQLIDDNDSFVILPEDYDELLNKAEELVNGIVYYDMGCGVMGASLPISGMSALIASISGSTDPFYIGNQINNTISESTANNPTVADENKQTVKDGFFQRLINFITQTLAQAVCTAPQIRKLLSIVSAFQNNGIPQIGNAKDDLKKFKIYLQCLIKTAMALINKFIFNLVITFLIALLQPVVRKIIKEKINQYVGIIKSLTVGDIL
jgi:hypothetical protein